MYPVSQQPNTNSKGQGWVVVGVVVLLLLTALIFGLCAFYRKRDEADKYEDEQLGRIAADIKPGGNAYMTGVALCAARLGTKTPKELDELNRLEKKYQMVFGKLVCRV